jgi:hypothetical protein
VAGGMSSSWGATPRRGSPANFLEREVGGRSRPGALSLSAGGSRLRWWPPREQAPASARGLQIVRTSAAYGDGDRAESVLTHARPVCQLPAETARWSTITQIYEGTNQIQRMVMARQLLKE